MRITRHVLKQLAAYCDGQLGDADTYAVAGHLAACDRCRAALDDVEFAGSMAGRLAVMTPPASVWASIEAAYTPAPRRAAWKPSLRAAAAALAIALTGTALTWWLDGVPAPAWQVTRSGASQATVGMAGEWVETDLASSARIVVGDIGTVDMSPGTRVRLGTVTATEYRMALARGTLDARIAAPPRLFFVDTPASTVVDLGCAYTVTADEEGTGLLRVTEGWAALEWQGRASLVPAGARARMYAGRGPGTPYFEDAPPALVDALTAIDLGDPGTTALEIVLTTSRVRDTLTLWHLLPRVGEGDRGTVYERIAELTPPPADVSREQVLALDPDALRQWREELAWKW